MTYTNLAPFFDGVKRAKEDLYWDRIHKCEFPEGD